jgi:Fe-S-cluster containining protein
MVVKKSKLQDCCTGHCCEDIGLSISPRILEVVYQNWIFEKLYKNGDHIGMNCQIPDWSSLKNSSLFSGIIHDIHLIYPMLIFVYKDDIHPDGGVQIKDTVVYHYRCKHFDKAKRICTIYDIRPRMCRSFPNNGFCGYENCTCREFVHQRPKGWKYGMTVEEHAKMMSKAKGKERNLNANAKSKNA